MGPLIRLVIALLFVAMPASAPAQERWATYIGEAARRFELPEIWIRRVIAAESGGRTHIGGRPIRSGAGAMGLMQLMPGTWAELRLRLDLGHDPDDPRDNILAGAFYLRQMHDRFGYPGLFAAYNAGPARYARHLTTGVALPRETQAYVAFLVGGEPGSVVNSQSGGHMVASVDPIARASRPSVPEAIFFPLGGLRRNDIVPGT